MLSPKELMKYNKKVLPENITIGPKQVEYLETEDDIRKINTKLDNIEEIIALRRVKMVGMLVKAVWRSELKLAEVTKKSGGHWEFFGHTIESKLYLYPEECLYLIDTGVLELTYNDVPLSLQRAYVLISTTTETTMDKYRVYQHLSLLGYKVMRHSPVNVFTKYEMDIDIPKIGVKLSETRRKRKSSCETIPCEGDSSQDAVNRINCDENYLKTGKNCVGNIGNEQLSHESDDGVKTNHRSPSKKCRSVEDECACKAKEEMTDLRTIDLSRDSDDRDIQKEDFHRENNHLLKNNDDVEMNAMRFGNREKRESLLPKMEAPLNMESVDCRLDDGTIDLKRSSDIHTVEKDDHSKTFCQENLKLPETTNSATASTYKSRTENESVYNEELSDIASKAKLPTIDFDVYDTSKGQFRKSVVKIPSWRVRVFSCDDPPPSVEDMCSIDDHCQDKVPLIYAVVHPDFISFLEIAPVQLPTINR